MPLALLAFQRYCYYYHAQSVRAAREVARRAAPAEDECGASDSRREVVAGDYRAFYVVATPTPVIYVIRRFYFTLFAVV